MRLLTSGLLSSLALLLAGLPAQVQLALNERDYFSMPGLDVMAFQDFYAEGHQSGVSIIQNGVRIASNGDLRLDIVPGQWQPTPKQVQRQVDKANGEIITTLAYPDESRDRKGFNPILYPDLKLGYQVRVKPEGAGFRITVDLDQPLPAEWVGKVGFNFELYPGEYFGRTWMLGDRTGLFPRQPNGPQQGLGTEAQPVALAWGRKLTVAPESDALRMNIESRTSDLQLLDARNKHNNGWFVVRALVPANASKGAIEWIVRPHAIPGWTYSPVIHVSQMGYHPEQKKVAIIELDPRDTQAATFHLKRVSDDGALVEVAGAVPPVWGDFLRYRYRTFDFSSVKQPGVYVAEYGTWRSQPFRIAKDIYQRDTWQPVLQYFLPAQMCHMRVEEQYRIWHGACHLDDARMAPVNYNHFDGYLQGPSTLCNFKSGETVPGLNVGGWHDAGDNDLRVESQADEVSILADAYESFGVKDDDTTIDQTKHLVKIHQPDGKPDLLQQVEHGVLTLLGSYRSLGQMYRGIIVPTLEQYVILGDTVNDTDNLCFDPTLKAGTRTSTHSSVPDDRWLFTEKNASHHFKGVAALAIAGRVMKDFNPALAKESLEAAEALWKQDPEPGKGADERLSAAVELWLSTSKPEYRTYLLAQQADIVTRIDHTGPIVAKAVASLKETTFTQAIREAVGQSFARTVKAQKETPFGVPYRPHIWGAGWEIQAFGVQQYHLHHAFPDLVSGEYLLNALNFVLGVHPGENTASFASGVGARSTTVAYGFNRADWSYIPGGVASGTALIRPDFPELKDFPYLWQQMEYVMGGGSSHYMFLVLAADQVLNGKNVF